MGVWVWGGGGKKSLTVVRVCVCGVWRDIKSWLRCVCVCVCALVWVGGIKTMATTQSSLPDTDNTNLGRQLR